MKSVIVEAPAKINLFLEVRERLENGYHNLDGIMQSVNLTDTIKATKTYGRGITIYCPDVNISRMEENLVVRAADAFFACRGIVSPSVHFDIIKRIPVSAGLAGGSSDAAATLIALNLMFDGGMSEEELCAIGKTIGADVPFCIKKGTCRAQGIGEVLTPIPRLPDCYIVIALGDERVCTKWAFEEIDKSEKRVIHSVEDTIACFSGGSLEEIGSHLYNVFETVSPYKHEIKELMKRHDTVGTLMSGSGPSVFGLFTGGEKATAAKEELSSLGYNSYLCRPF